MRQELVTSTTAAIATAAETTSTVSTAMAAATKAAFALEAAFTAAARKATLTGFALFGFAHAQGTPLQILVVQLCDCSLAFFPIGHFNKPKPT